MKYIESIQHHLFEIVRGFNIRESPPPFGSAKCEDLVNLTWLLMLQFPFVCCGLTALLGSRNTSFWSMAANWKEPYKG